MNNTTKFRLLVVVFVIVIASGCAKLDVVKNEEPIAQTSPSALNAMKNTAKSELEGVTKPDSLKIPFTSGSEEAHESLSPILNAAELKATLENIYFDFDSTLLSAEARTILTKNAYIIKNEPSVTVRIEGNCDERGSEEYNLALGDRRAKAAAMYLKTMGVDEGRISTISYGKEKPADPGHDEAALAKNRRDEFWIVPKR